MLLNPASGSRSVLVIDSRAEPALRPCLWLLPGNVQERDSGSLGLETDRLLQEVALDVLSPGHREVQPCSPQPRLEDTSSVPAPVHSALGSQDGVTIAVQKDTSKVHEKVHTACFVRRCAKQNSCFL